MPKLHNSTKKLKCPACNFESNKVNVKTTEIGQVRWLNPIINEEGIISDLGKRWMYEGGETLEEKGYSILCKNCGKTIKEIT